MAPRTFFLVILVFFVSISAQAQVSLFEEVRSLVLSDQEDKVLSVVTPKKIKALKGEDRALALFTRGYFLMQQKKWDQAAINFGRSIQARSRLAPYAHYYIGVIAMEKGNPDAAKKKFDLVIKDVPNRELGYRIRHHLGKIAIGERHWRTAYKHFHYLERRWRYEEKYPQVLWDLVKIELNRKRKWRACQWARKLYYRYPAHDLTKEWGLDLKQAKFEGRRLGCVASPRDQERRIRRLQWSGASERAREELETLKKRSGKVTQFEVDEMMATFLTNEGFVDEAINLLMPHYSKKKSNHDFLELLAKAAARAGRYHTSVASHYNAYDLNPRSGDGRRSLFRAGFLSYQVQDYDAAVRTFEKFISQYGGSGLSRSAMWYLAWVRYLKGDHQGAYDDFSDILEQRKKNWRHWRSYSEERIRYWMAMSLMRMDKIDEAKEIFTSLSADPLRGYYSVAASSRIRSLTPQPTDSSVPLRNPAQAGNGVVVGSEMADPDAGIQVPGSVVPQPGVEEEGEEDVIKAEAGAEEKDTEVASEDPEEKEDKEEPESPPQVTTFKDPKLRHRFDRARDLISIGLNEWGRWELYEIERRTRNQSYLKMLMGAYEGIGSYHRSSYISDIHFSTDRQNKGMKEARDLWEFAYPRAFESHVVKNAEHFAIPKQFVWAIIRAESRFRPDIMSPVGARGLMQLMPHTARKVSNLLGDETVEIEDLTRPAVNIRLGTKYLHRLGKKFNRMIPLMAAGYNAGPHRVEQWLASFGSLDMDEWIEHIPFTQTRDYAKKVVRYYTIYSELYGVENQALAWLNQPLGVDIPADPATRETWEPL